MEYCSAIKRNEIVPFVETLMDLETVTQRESEKEKQIFYNIACMWNLEKCYRWTYLQSRNRDMDVENKFMDTKVGVWEELGDWDWHIYTTMYKINN